MADTHLIGTNLPFEPYEVAHIVAFVILSGLYPRQRVFGFLHHQIFLSINDQ